MSARDTVERFLQTTVSGRPGDLADYYADAVVIEMPFAVEPLYPSRVETTREELRARFAAGAAVRTYTHLSNVAIHETADPEVVIAEYEINGRLVATGESFTLPFVMVMTIRDGQIAHTRDYSNPVAGAKALGRLPDLVAALNG